MVRLIIALVTVAVVRCFLLGIVYPNTSYSARLLIARGYDGGRALASVNWHAHQQITECLTLTNPTFVA